MKRQKNVRLPLNLCGRGRRKHIEDRLVCKVTLTGSGERTVKHHFKTNGPGITLQKHPCGIARTHSVRTARTVTYLIKLPD